MTTETSPASTLSCAPPPPPLALKMLAPETREAIETVGRRESHPAGAIVFAEGDDLNDLFLVEEGVVSCLRAPGESGEEITILEIGAGDVLGELSFLDGGPQQLTARAKTDCVLRRVAPFDLIELSEGEHLYDNLRASNGIAVAERLRAGTELHVKTLQHQIEVLRQQQHFGHFFLYTMLMMAIGMIVSNLIASHVLKVNVYTQQFTWAYLLVLLIPTVAVVAAMRIPPADMGLTRRGLGRSLREAAAISLGLAGLTLLWVQTSGFGLVPNLTVTFHPVLMLGYAVHSFVQEVVARGILQSSFQRFLHDRRGVLSVAVTSVSFGLFHLHFGYLAVAITMVSSVLFGAFYLRNPNIAGVTLLHFAAGACAFSSGIL